MSLLICSLCTNAASVGVGGQARTPGSHTCRSPSLSLRCSLWKSRRALTWASYSAELRLPASIIKCGWWGSREEETQLLESPCLWTPVAQSHSLGRTLRVQLPYSMGPTLTDDLIHLAWDPEIYT